MQANQLLEALQWPYATKRFDASRTIDTDTWSSLEQALVLTASSYGLRKRFGFGKQAMTGFINPYLYEQYNSKERKDLLFDVPAGSNNASVFNIASDPDQWSGRFAAKLTDFSTGAHYYLPLNGTSSNGAIDFDLSSTGKGFDAATGLGSINGQGLFDGLSQVWASL